MEDALCFGKIARMRDLVHLKRYMYREVCDSHNSINNKISRRVVILVWILSKRPFKHAFKNSITTSRIKLLALWWSCIVSVKQSGIYWILLIYEIITLRNLIFGVFYSKGGFLCQKLMRIKKSYGYHVNVIKLS